MEVDEQSSKPRPTRKHAVVPPILIHSSSPRPQTPDQHATNLGCMLPQISSQRSVLGGGQPVETPYNGVQPLWSNSGVHFKNQFEVKSEPAFGQQSSCAFQNSAQLQKSRFPPSHLSPLSISNHNIHHLQLPNGSYTAQSPTFSDVSSIRLTPHSPFSRLSFSDASFKQKGRQIRSQRASLPPLPTGYLAGSNTDLDEANPSPLIPPPNSLSPYLGSGISDTPWFPSIVSPLHSANHLSRKRALSTSPLSDLLDFNSLIRTSPNSLVALINSSNPISPNPAGSIGHLVGQSSPAPTSQFKIEQRKTSIEHNHNSDGTTNTTITNQITISEHPHQTKYNMVSEGQLNLAVQSSEPMEYDQVSSKSGTSSYSQPLQMKEEPNEPHICLWDGCVQTFDELEDLVQHIESAHIEKGKLDDFTCMWQSCPRNRKPFNARYKLLIHMRIHSGEKPNKCTYPGCSKAFSRLENLKIHLRTHTGEKPYLCQYPGCKKSFSNSSDRSKHQKTHFDQKPYACTHPGCTKRYTDPSSLRKHAKTHLQRKKPRNDDQPEGALDGCLTIQSLQCSSGHSSSSGNSKSTTSKSSNSKPKLKPIRPGKLHPDQKPSMASITIQHHPQLCDVLHEQAAQPQPPPLVPYTMAEPHHSNYYLPSPFPAHRHHLAPPSPNTLPSPMMPSPEQCSPSQISPSSHPQPQVCLQAYQVSPKMAQLSPGSCAFPNCQPSCNPTSNVYSSNPASPMQVAYSPGQPLARIASTNNLYQQCNGTYTEPPSVSTGNLGMSVPLQHVPFHPPPDYTEATSLNGTHFMPCSYPLAIASEYPDHHMPALPGAGHPHGTQFHQ